MVEKAVQLLIGLWLLGILHHCLPGLQSPSLYCGDVNCWAVMQSIREGQLGWLWKLLTQCLSVGETKRNAGSFMSWHTAGFYLFYLHFPYRFPCVSFGNFTVPHWSAVDVIYSAFSLLSGPQI